MTATLDALGLAALPARGCGQCGEQGNLAGTVSWPALQGCNTEKLAELVVWLCGGRSCAVRSGPPWLPATMSLLFRSRTVLQLKKPPHLGDRDVHLCADLACCC